jgi:hypothetical protein
VWRARGTQAVRVVRRVLRRAWKSMGLWRNSRRICETRHNFRLVIGFSLLLSGEHPIERGAKRARAPRSARSIATNIA